MMLCVTRAGFGVLLHANTLGDLCPGTPSHCLVTAKFAVANDITFDLGGRMLDLAPSAQLIGDNGASFSFINASAITLQKGSVVSIIGKGVSPGTMTIQSNGACTFSGRILANAAVADSLGGDGGDLSVTCVGISVEGMIEAKAAADPLTGGGQGGGISLDAGTGSVSIAKGAKIDARGKGESGGTVSIVGDGSCSFDGRILANGTVANGGGGGGGEVSATCGGISFSSGKIDVRGAAGPVEGDGFGGTILLDGGTASITVAKGVKVDASARGGDAGSITISTIGPCTFDARVLANTTGVVSGVGGNGGDVTAACMGISLGAFARIEAKGLSGPLVEAGAGGTITLDAAVNSVSATNGAKLNAQGAGGGGGRVIVLGGADCPVNAVIEVDNKKRGGVTGLGGQVQLTCGGNVTVGKKTSAMGSARGGQIAIEGCNLTIDTQGVVSTNGPQAGENDLTAHKQLMITGHVLAVSSTTANSPGINKLQYRVGATIPNANYIKPSTAPTQNLSLTPCP